MTTHLFRAEDLRCSIGGMPVLKGISFELLPGEALVIAGRSGCGKSTLLEMCAGLRPVQEGKVLWEGTCLAEMTYEERAEARQRTGFVFQKSALIHNFTIFDNIALPLRYHSSLAERDIRIRVAGLMEELGLFGVDRKFANELSVGQAKCAALARALVMDPRIVFLDEPTAGVDPFTETCVLNVINHFRSEKLPAIIMLCNDIRTIRSMKCPVKILDNGKLIGLHEQSELADEYRPAILSTFQEIL
jgi:phospholipid/cholesterol/gamma-HCH transport system ATP-binding protein